MNSNLSELNGKIICHAAISDEYSDGGRTSITVKNGIAVFPINLHLKNASGWVNFATIEESEAIPANNQYLVYTFPVYSGGSVQFTIKPNSPVISARCSADSENVEVYCVLMWITV